MFKAPSQPSAFDQMIRRSQLLRERKYRPYHSQVEAIISTQPIARRIWRAWDVHEKTTFLADFLSRFQSVTSAVVSAITDRAELLLTKPEVSYEYD